MSQPFFVAEVFAGRSGKYVNIKDTVASFKEILEGKTDTLPEQAFFLAGTLRRRPGECSEARVMRVGGPVTGHRPGSRSLRRCA